jgi:hypothetical protein
MIQTKHPVHEIRLGVVRAAIWANETEAGIRHNVTLERLYYVGSVDQAGLQWFLPEDVIPRDLLRHYVRGWFTRSMTAVWALLDEEDAEAIRADLTAGHHQDACNLLLNRAVELLSLLSVLPDLAGTATTRVGVSRRSRRGAANPRADAADEAALCSPGSAVAYQFAVCLGLRTSPSQLDKDADPGRPNVCVISVGRRTSCVFRENMVSRTVAQRGRFHRESRAIREYLAEGMR